LDRSRDQFVKNLETLRNRYIKALDMKIERMKLAFESIEQDETAAVQKIRALHTLSHDMSGSCAFFGLAEMGEVAQLLEFYLHSLEAGLPAIEDRQMKKVWAMILALEQAKDHSLQNPTWTPETLIPDSLKPGAD